MGGWLDAGAVEAVAAVALAGMDAAATDGHAPPPRRWQRERLFEPALTKTPPFVTAATIPPPSRVETSCAPQRRGCEEPRRLGVAVRVPVRPGARCRGRPRPALSGLRDLPLTAVGLVEYITKGGRFL